MTMRVDVVTIFPELVSGPLHESLLGKAIQIRRSSERITVTAQRRLQIVDADQ